jgi:hypothetical protein
VAGCSRMQVLLPTNAPLPHSSLIFAQPALLPCNPHCIVTPTTTLRYRFAIHQSSRTIHLIRTTRLTHAVAVGSNTHRCRRIPPGLRPAQSPLRLIKSPHTPQCSSPLLSPVRRDKVYPDLPLSPVLCAHFLHRPLPRSLRALNSRLHSLAHVAHCSLYSVFNRLLQRSTGALNPTYHQLGRGSQRRPNRGREACGNGEEIRKTR